MKSLVLICRIIKSHQVDVLEQERVLSENLHESSEMTWQTIMR